MRFWGHFIYGKCSFSAVEANQCFCMKKRFPETLDVCLKGRFWLCGGAENQTDFDGDGYYKW